MLRQTLGGGGRLPAAVVECQWVAGRWIKVQEMEPSDAACACRPPVALRHRAGTAHSCRYKRALPGSCTKLPPSYPPSPPKLAQSPPSGCPQPSPMLHPPEGQAARWCGPSCRMPGWVPSFWPVCTLLGSPEGSLAPEPRQLLVQPPRLGRLCCSLGWARLRQRPSWPTCARG